MADIEQVAEIRLGPIEDPAGQRIALEEITRKINELVRTVNQLIQSNT